MSDSHGSQGTVLRALRIAGERKAATVLHCGDIDDAETARLFAGMPTHFVLGNCDHDERVMARAIREAGASLHGRFAEIELEGKRIAFLHGDDHKAMALAEHKGAYDYLFYGHTHTAEQHLCGKTRVVNPGALFRARPKTIVLLDLSTDELEFVPVVE